MKRIFLSILALGLFFAPVYGNGIADDLSRLSDLSDTSYAMGMLIGADLKETGMAINYGAFTRGLKDALEGLETRISMDEAVLRIQVAYNAAIQEQAEKNRGEEERFLEENGQRPEIATTGSGLQYEVIRAGEGPRPGPADWVRVHYEGSLLDGTVFDSSYERDEAAELPLDGVIPGWAEGLQLMDAGSAYRLYIPSWLAYGDQGAGSVIPPSSLLIFDVELLEILGEEPFGTD